MDNPPPPLGWDSPRLGSAGLNQLLSRNLPLYSFFSKGKELKDLWVECAINSSMIDVLSLANMSIFKAVHEGRNNVFAHLILRVCESACVFSSVGCLKEVDVCIGTDV